MIERCRRQVCALLTASLLFPFVPRPGYAAVIPAGLDNALPAVSQTACKPEDNQKSAQAEGLLASAGLSAPEAGARARSLDAAESAQLEKTQLKQQGGDALVAVLAIIGLVALVLFVARRV